jgi:hypothetical protein
MNSSRQETPSQPRWLSTTPRIGSIALNANKNSAKVAKKYRTTSGSTAKTSNSINLRSTNSLDTENADIAEKSFRKDI